MEEEKTTYFNSYFVQKKITGISYMISNSNNDIFLVYNSLRLSPFKYSMQILLLLGIIKFSNNNNKYYNNNKDKNNK